MKGTGRKGGILSTVFFALVLASSFAVHGQTGTPIDLSSLTLVPSNAIPFFGNFYYINSYGITPLPGLGAFSVRCRRGDLASGSAGLLTAPATS